MNLGWMIDFGCFIMIPTIWTIFLKKALKIFILASETIQIFTSYVEFSDS